MSFEEVTKDTAKVEKVPRSDAPVHDPSKPRRFSYSASSMLQSCERKYFLKYVMDMPKDEDVTEDATALVFGKCYHWALETSQHLRGNYSVEVLQKHCKEQGLEMVDFYKVAACVEAYFRLREKSGLHAIGLEDEVGDESIVGYVDCVLADRNNRWWIVDLKTSGMVMESLFPRLAMDPQLNLYAAYKDQLAKKLGLRPVDFAGIRYCVVAKGRTAPKAGEALAAYVARATPECYDVEIPEISLDPRAALDKMMRLKQQSDMMKEKFCIKQTECNRSNCLQWNRSCEWWSNCHQGHTFTECQEMVKVFTTSTMIDRTHPEVARQTDIDLLF